MTGLPFIRKVPQSEASGPTAPGTPYLVSRTETSITVAFSPSSDPSGVAGYRAYIAQSPATPVRVSALNVDTVAATYTFTGLTTGLTYSIRFSAVDVWGNESALSGTYSDTPLEASLGSLVLNTEFDGLSLVSVQGDGTDVEYYRFSGTDGQTGQVFDANNPSLWGSSAPKFQVIGAGGRTADQHFTISTPSGAGKLPSPGRRLRVVRNFDHVQPSQCALKFEPTWNWTLQGMFFHAFRFYVPPTFPVTTQGQFTLAEVKSGGGDAPYPVVHLLCTREDIGGTVQTALKLGALRIDGANTYETWGSLWTPTATCVDGNGNPQDAYYNGIFFKVVGTLQQDAWYSVGFGGRMKTHNGNVAGNGADGWAGAWWAGPNVDGSPKEFSEMELKMLVTGRNLGYVTTPSVDYLFLMNHYVAGALASSGGDTGLNREWSRMRTGTDWWTGAPTRPAACV